MLFNRILRSKVLTPLPLLITLVALSACGGIPKHPLEKDLGVDGSITSQYNNLALNPSGARLAFDGYIIGIEKIEKERETKRGPEEPYLQIIEAPKSDLECPREWPPIGSMSDQQGRECHYMRRVLKQDKTMAVTHVIAHEPTEAATRYLYNIYATSDLLDGCAEQSTNSDLDAPLAEYCHLKGLVNESGDSRSSSATTSPGYFMDGIKALRESLKADLHSKLASKSEDRRYTHIVLAAAGWDNDQEVSVAHYNAVLSNIQQAAEEQGASFRPLFIGLTWPSVWGNDDWIFGLRYQFLKLIGYGNKANDADEIGFTIFNLLLNEVVADIKTEHQDLAVVAFGHSFGARLTSRAVYSAGHLKRKANREEPTVDVFIGLQPAFSVRRFLVDEGWEGAPYQPQFAPGVPIIVTTSTHDSANPLARYLSRARHVGGQPGLEWMRAFPLGGDLTEHDETRSDQDYRFVVLEDTTADGRIDGACPDWRETYQKHPKAVFVVDAKTFVRSHGDVVDLPTARVMWDGITCFTKAAS